MYILTVKFKDDYLCFKKNDRYFFQNITLLVGEQGCGKSSLLRCLQKQEYLDVQLTDLGLKGVDTFYFDFEKDNPRVKDPRLFSNVDGTNRGIGLGNAVISRFKSHGEILKNYSINGLRKAKDCVIFFDEPESSLSIRNQFKLIQEIEMAVKRNCQFIIATHCFPLIESQGNVLSLEHNSWMSSKDFIETQR